jgi:hypothetical protein
MLAYISSVLVRVQSVEGLLTRLDQKSIEVEKIERRRMKSRQPGLESAGEFGCIKVEAVLIVNVW